MASAPLRRFVAERSVAGGRREACKIVGGLGSFWGVVLASLVVGVVRGLTVYFVPPMAEASMYLLMFLVLLVRPRGLLGERFERLEA